ncbi:hypothetical protein PP744_gp003 [Rhizobium phage RHph_N38]|uniref:Uncharacterized protein n=1 Tax=Rhizobium phage RHph_N38 TaxID=2509750 RepID=A0A7S5R3H3_9CAUD|nr:hypothetical protein PP744_gp003 [Rhizobium phage RHph_N38]QIG70466.1 hypothetical protein EVB89_003 [Rhizobium phage RHph_N38]
MPRYTIWYGYDPANQCVYFIIKERLERIDYVWDMSQQTLGL